LGSLKGLRPFKTHPSPSSLKERGIKVLRLKDSSRGEVDKQSIEGERK